MAAARRPQAGHGTGRDGGRAEEVRGTWFELLIDGEAARRRWPGSDDRPPQMLAKLERPSGVALPERDSSRSSCSQRETV